MVQEPVRGIEERSASVGHGKVQVRFQVLRPAAASSDSSQALPRRHPARDRFLIHRGFREVRVVVPAAVIPFQNERDSPAFVVRPADQSRRYRHNGSVLKARQLCRAVGQPGRRLYVHLITPVPVKALPGHPFSGAVQGKAVLPSPFGATPAASFPLMRLTLQEESREEE